MVLRKHAGVGVQMIYMGHVGLHRWCGSFRVEGFGCAGLTSFRYFEHHPHVQKLPA